MKFYISKLKLDLISYLELILLNLLKNLISVMDFYYNLTL